MPILAGLPAPQPPLVPLVAPTYWRSEPICINSGAPLSALQTPMHLQVLDRP